MVQARKEKKNGIGNTCLWAEIKYGDDLYPYLILHGKTYPVKERLKKLGFRFDWSRGKWYAKIEDGEQLERLLKGVGANIKTETPLRSFLERLFWNNPKGIIKLAKAMGIDLEKHKDVNGNIVINTLMIEVYKQLNKRDKKEIINVLRKARSL